MRQALILGARPLLTRGKLFPRVPLGAGGWRIEVENRVSSKLRLTLYRPVPGNKGEYMLPSVAELNGDASAYTFDGPAEVSIEIYEAGNEHAINVMAVSL